MPRPNAAFLLALLVSSTPVFAQTLTTFVDGQPAVAAQVNQNFTVLLNEINALKAQVAALTPAPLAQAIVGTWDTITIETTAFEKAPEGQGHDFFFRANSGKGSLTLNADGSFTTSANDLSYRMHVFNNRVPFVLGPPLGSFIRSDLYTGVQYRIPDNYSDSGTYTLNGSTLTLKIGTESVVLRASLDGNVLIMHSPDDTTATIAIALKR